MRLKAKLKKTKLNPKVLKNLKSLQSSLKAGHPAEAKETHEKDKNGFTVAYKAYEINYSSKNYKPYLQISYLKNAKKYKKLFKNLAKKPAKTKAQNINKIGAEMVQDIKNTLHQTQLSPIGTTIGRLFGAITFVKNKRI